MEYYSAIKRNDISSHQKTWRNLKWLLLSERSQSDKATDYMIPTTEHSEKSKTIDSKKVNDCQGFGGTGEWKRDEEGEHRAFLGQ